MTYVPCDLERLHAALKLPAASALTHATLNQHANKLSVDHRKLLFGIYATSALGLPARQFSETIGWSLKKTLIERNNMLRLLRYYITTGSGPSHTPELLARIPAL